VGRGTAVGAVVGTAAPLQAVITNAIVMATVNTVQSGLVLNIGPATFYAPWRHDPSIARANTWIGGNGIYCWLQASAAMLTIDVVLGPT
jgi:hypothetical protein